VPGRCVSSIQSVKARADSCAQCDRLSASAEAIKAKLQQEYDAAVVAIKDRFFASIEGGPTSEACADAPRFVAKYFLTTGLLGSTPDRSKTTAPLAIKSYHSREKLLEAVEAVPGLAVHQSPNWVLVGWDTELDRAVQPHFEKLGGLPVSEGGGIIAQATFDFDRFALKHLHIDVAENYRVTSSPGHRPTAAISFYDSNNFPHHNRLQELATKVPGLHVKEFKPECGWAPVYTTVVGWDAAMVRAEIEKLEDKDRLSMEKAIQEEKAEEERVEARKKAAEAGKRAAWERLMNPHRDLVDQNRPRPGPLTAEDLVGSYVVIWEGEEGKQWGDPYCEYPRYESRLDVFPGKSTHGVRASFHFGLVEGTMLLATTRRSVELLRDEQSKGRGKHCDQEESDEEGEEVPRTGEKRQLGSVADPWGVQAAMAKRQKPNPVTRKQAPINNRAYFQFACNSVNGYPEVDDNNSHIGHFDFDDTKLSAKGQFSLPFYYGDDAPPQPLTLYKTPTFLRMITSRWNGICVMEEDGEGGERFPSPYFGAHPFLLYAAQW
jgi:hypothetical protein